MDPCIVDDSVEIPRRCSFVIEFIILKFFECIKKNFGIINSITKLQLVGISTERRSHSTISYTVCLGSVLTLRRLMSYIYIWSTHS